MIAYSPNMPIVLAIVATFALLGLVAAFAASAGQPRAEARGGFCAELSADLPDGLRVAAPGLRYAETSEDLEDMAQYINLCYGDNDGKWFRLIAVQQRQLILEMRELNAALERREEADNGG